MRTTQILVTAILVVSFTITASTARAQEMPVSQDVQDSHRILQWSTASAMLVTATLGTILAINKPTLFGDGECANGSPIFGEYGCHGLSVVHGISALVTLALYAANLTLEVDAFGWPGLGHGDGYAAASYVHLIGMAALPLAGLIAAVPSVLGLDSDEGSDFARIMRTLHLFAAYTTVGTFITTAAIDLD